MNDNDLVEIAARAAGWVGEWKYLEAYAGRVSGWYFVLADHSIFSPLESDGDALRLAVRLKLPMSFGVAFPDNDGGSSVTVDRTVVCHAELYPKHRALESEMEFAHYMQRPERMDDKWERDNYTAARRAIVLAAAAIGENMR